MNINRFLLCIVLIGMFFPISAQTTDTILRYEICLDTVLAKTNLKMVTYRDRKVYKAPVHAVDSVWFKEGALFVRCMNSPDVIENISKKIAQAVTVCEFSNVTTKHYQVESSSPQLSKYDVSIDEFLNIEDSTIFTSKFRALEKSQIHPRSYKYYCLIAEIHQIYVKMESLSQLNWTEKNKADKVMDELYTLFENITNKFKTEREEYLTPSQKTFYENKLKLFKKLYYADN